MLNYQKGFDLQDLAYIPSDALRYRCEIYRTETGKYLAKCLLLDPYDGYLEQWRAYDQSPLFDSLEEAESYAREQW